MITSVPKLKSSLHKMKKNYSAKSPIVSRLPPPFSTYCSAYIHETATNLPRGACITHIHTHRHHHYHMYDYIQQCTNTINTRTHTHTHTRTQTRLLRDSNIKTLLTMYFRFFQFIQNLSFYAWWLPRKDGMKPVVADKYTCY